MALSFLETVSYFYQSLVESPRCLHAMRHMTYRVVWVVEPDLFSSQKSYLTSLSLVYRLNSSHIPYFQPINNMQMGTVINKIRTLVSAQ